MLTGEDKGRNPARQHLARDWAEQQIASRASCKRELSRIERNAREHLAKLRAEIVRLDKDDVARAAKAFVAGEHQPAVNSSASEQMRPIRLRIRDDIGAQQSQPSPQPHQHPIGSKLRGLLHIGGVYYRKDANWLAARLQVIL